MTAYLSVDEFKAMALPAAALVGITDPQIEQAIDNACEEADGFLERRYSMPLTAWGNDLKMTCSNLAAWRLMKFRGFNPENPSDTALRMGFDDAMRWLEDVRDEKRTPNIVDTAPVARTFLPSISSKCMREW